MANKERQVKSLAEVEPKLEAESPSQKDVSKIGEVGARRTLRDFLVSSLGIKNERPDNDSETTELSQPEEANPETPVLSLLENYRGAQPEHLNEYMEDRARRMNTTVEQLTAKQYEEILEDSKGFKEWLAEKLVSDLIASRKDSIRAVFEQRPRKNRLGEEIEPEENLERRVAEVRRKHPTSSELTTKLRQKRDSYVPEVSRLRREMDEVDTLRQVDLAKVVDAYESALRQLQIVRAGEAAMAPMRQALTEARANLAREAVESKREGEAALKAAVENHQAEIDELKQRQPFEVKGGLKREMSLSLRRWGEVLKDVIQNEDERDVFVQGDEIKLDQVSNWGNLDPTLRDRLANFFDREIDMINGVRDGVVSPDNKARKLNLDAIIQTDSEARLASFYLEGLGERIRATFRKQGQGEETTNLLKRYESLRQFLLDSSSTKGDGAGSEIVTMEILKDWGRISYVGKGNKEVGDLEETTFKVVRNLERLIEKRGSESLFLKQAGDVFSQSDLILQSCGGSDIERIMKSAGRALRADPRAEPFVVKLAQEINRLIGRQNSGVGESQQREIRKAEYRVSRDNKAFDCPVDERTIVEDLCNYSEEWDKEWGLMLDELKKRVNSKSSWLREGEKQRLIETVTAKLAFSPWTGEVARDPRNVLRWEKIKMEKLQALIEWSIQKT